MELRESLSSALPRVDLVVSERPGVREKASPRAGGARGGRSIGGRHGGGEKSSRESGEDRREEQG